MLSKLRTAWNAFRTLGPRQALHDLSYRAVNRATYFKVLKVMKMTKIDPEYLKGDERDRYQFLDRDQLLRFADEPRYDLPADFVRGTLEKGDECYAVVDGEKLANYGWYSRQPTNVEDDLRLRFDPSYVYMYKGFTPPEYRGKRLHAVTMTKALQAYLDRGPKGLLSYVESNNFSSLKSCARMGYEVIGTIVVARAFGRYATVASKGCREYGVTLEPVRPAARRRRLAGPARVLGVSR